MLLSVTLPDALMARLGPGCVALGPEHALLPNALGFALFDTASQALPRSGQVEVQLTAALDARSYGVSRALDVPEHWQVRDLETGWLAASGAVDAQRWLRANLDVPDDLPLQRLFHEIVSISLPVMRGWLVDEPGLRERKFRELLRMERYRVGTRWLDDVIANVAATIADLESAARILEGRDQLLAGIRTRYEADRAAFLGVGEVVASLQLKLATAEADHERLRSHQAELTEVQQELDRRRLAMAAAEAQAERWRHWLTVRDRARKIAVDRSADWRAYNEAVAELGKLGPRLSSLEAVQSELQSTVTDALALQREVVLVEGQLALVHEAETAAGDLSEGVHHQQQLEQQLSGAQERVLRLEQINRGLQSTLADAKRNEVQLGEVERQLDELEQLAPQAMRVKKLEQDLAEQQSQLRDAGRQVDHLHFLETATRALTGYLDDLRKGASVSERLAAKAGAGNGANQDRTMVGHLREAIEHQLDALERQVRDWQAQSRELSPATQKVNQLRSSIHQLEQELAATRKVELKLGGGAALKQHRKQLRERFDDLKKVIDAALKEQQDCLDAPATASQVRQELTGLNDPRSERLALLHQVRRKEVLENELRQLQRDFQERTDRQIELQRQMEQLHDVQEQVAQLERRRDETHEGYCEYLAQQAVAELASVGERELDVVLATLQDHQRLLQQVEARETSLRSSMSELHDAPLRSAAFKAQLAEAEARAAECKERYQQSSDDNAAANENRDELGRRRDELATHSRSERLLRQARSRVQEAEQVLGAELRQAVTALATPYAQRLLDQDAVEMGWAYGEAPALVRAGASPPLDELNDFDQACFILAFSLAIAADASRLGTVILSGLHSFPGLEDIHSRLPRLPDFDQFLLASAW